MTSLVVQTAFLGDVVLTTPLLGVLAARHGPVDVVTTPGAAPLLETHPAVRRVIAYDKNGADRGLGALWRLARRLRAERYEIAYLPHRSLRSAALVRLAGIPRRIGFDNGWPSLYTEARHHPHAGHAIDRLLALAGDLPSDTPEAPTLVPTAADREAADRFLRAHGIAAPFVAVAPGSIWGTKRWPYYAELAASLANRAGVVVIGGSDDEALGEAIVAAVAAAGGRAASACGEVSLRGAAALMARAVLLVTNDSAPLHLAAAVGTPIVAIFGPTIPAFGFAPRGPRDRVVELAGLACRPCSSHGPPVCPLGHHRCMKDLRVADVALAIRETGALSS